MLSLKPQSPHLQTLLPGWRTELHQRRTQIQDEEVPSRFVSLELLRPPGDAMGDLLARPNPYSHLIQNYRYTHSCQVPGCQWNYELHKYLVRLSARHNIEAERFPSPVSGCGKSVSRADLLPSYVERIHQ
jgi:hypothetical protein